MTIDQRFAAAGSWVLVLWGIGHAITIDILPLIFRVYLYEVDPTVFVHMRNSVFRFPFTGQTTAYQAFHGLSMWLGVSLVAFGVLNLLLARSGSDHHHRRMIYVVDIVFVTAFLTIGALCFFAIPVVGGALALLLYSVAMLTCVRRSPAA